MKKRAYILLVFAIFSIILSACGGTKTSGDEKGKATAAKSAHKFTLMYCYNDSFNPYDAKTKMNKELSLLMYDPLIKLDESFKPVNYLADSVTVEGNTCTVRLKSAAFSDGSAVTATDVAYSFGKAKESQTKYAARLASAVSCTAADSATVVFKSDKVDPYFANMLDFPIIKSGSDNLKDQNNLELPPIGCGRYIIDIANECLNANESHYITVPQIKKISLINTPDSEAMDHNLEIGAVSLYYSDLADGNVIRMSGKNSDVLLNNFVCLGINMDKKNILSNEKLRYAVSAAINRKKIVSEAYFGNARVANSPYNPAFEDAKRNQNAENSENLDVVLANLKEIGYNNKDSEGYYIDAGGRRLSISLLCNSDNKRRSDAAELIVSQLNKAGIAATLKSVSYEEYSALIAAKNFDMYIAETEIPQNMDFSAIVTKGAALAFGFPADAQPQTDGSAGQTDDTAAQADSPTVIEEATGKALADFYAGNASLTDVIAAFNLEMPVVPVCYRTGYVVYSRNITDEIKSSVSDIFFGFENCKYRN